MEDWNNHLSRSFVKRAMSADSDQDKLKMLSEGIQDAVNTFLVSLSCRSRAYFKCLLPFRRRELFLFSWI